MAGLALIPCVLFLAAAENSVPSRPPVLDSLVTKLRERQSQVKTIRCRTESHLTSWNAEWGRADFEIKATVWRKGESQAVALHRRVLPSAKMHAQEHSERSVWNPRYVASTWNSTTNARQRLHAGNREPGPRRVDALLHDNLNPMIFGFGNGFFLLTERIVNAPGIAKWEVEDRGKGIYELRAFIRDTKRPDQIQTQPRSLMVMDTARGYLITRAVFYNEEGRVWREVSVEPRILDGVGWIPATVKAIDYAPGLSSENRQRLGKEEGDDIVRIQTITYVDTKVNEPIPDYTFTLAFLELKERALIQRTNLDGTEEVVVCGFKRPSSWRGVGSGVEAIHNMLVVESSYLASACDIAGYLGDGLVTSLAVAPVGEPMPMFLSAARAMCNSADRPHSKP